MLTGRFTGRWWLPTTPARKRTGTLVLDWNARPFVELVGPLDNASVVDMAGRILGTRMAYPVVHGRTTDRRDITLRGVSVAVREMNLEDVESAAIELTAQTAFIGGRMRDPSRVRFRRMDLKLGRLTDWSRFPSIEQRLDPTRRAWSMELRDRWLPPVVANLPEGTLTVGLDQRSTGDLHRTAALERSASMFIIRREDLSVDEWIDVYVRPLRYLLTLATGLPISIDRMELSPGPRGRNRVEVVWMREPQPVDPDRMLAPDEVLFSLPSIEARLSDALTRWFTGFQDLKAVFDLVFSTRYASRMYEENRFLNLVQALEAYHRIRIGGRPDESEHEARAAAILDSCPPEHRTWLGEVLQNAGEFTLLQRITAMVRQHPWLVRDVTGRASSFAWRVAATRHYHTHWDPGGRRAAVTGTDLWPLNERLMVLLETCFLSEIGFAPSEIERLIKNGSRSYRALKLNPGI